MRSVRMPDHVPGQLWLDAMPGRYSGWTEFEAQARQVRLGVVVCLTPREEMAELSPDYHAAVTTGRIGFRWMHSPVRNFGVPADAAGFRADVERIAQALRLGDAVLLHCAAGLGRTGTAAACVLKALGLPVSDAIKRVRDAGSIPQNAEQSGVVGWF